METRTLWSGGRAPDPRWWQLAALSTLLVLGIGRLGFDVSPLHAAVTMMSALATQAAATLARAARSRRAHHPVRIEWKSALITGLSLCLLLRANAPAWGALAAAIAVLSKFAIRARGRHVFNPANLGIMALVAAGAPVWVSPAQWGHAAVGVFAIGGAGAMVANRAARADVAWTFLAAWSALLAGRALWLQQPWSVPLHQLGNGALALFAFFMLTDPRTTPDARAGRVLFAVLVALGAYAIQFVLWRRLGLLASLVLCAPLVPFLDRWFPGPRHVWPTAPSRATPEERHDAETPPPVAAAAAAAR